MNTNRTRSRSPISEMAQALEHARKSPSILDIQASVQPESETVQEPEILPETKPEVDEGLEGLTVNPEKDVEKEEISVDFSKPSTLTAGIFFGASDKKSRKVRRCLRRQLSRPKYFHKGQLSWLNQNDFEAEKRQCPYCVATFPKFGIKLQYSSK